MSWDTEFSDPSTDELMYLAAIAQNRGLDPAGFGEDPNDRLTLLSKIFSMTGVNPVSLAGVDSGEAPEFRSLQREVYGANPLFTSAFDRIDAGADPMAALADVKKRAEAGEFSGLNMDKDFFANEDNESVVADIDKVLKDYAFERSKWNQEQAANQAEFRRPDGSRYKNAPLGGNDVFATANEFELLGRPKTFEVADSAAAGGLSAQKQKERAALMQRIGANERSVLGKATNDNSLKQEGAELQLARYLDKAKNTNVRSVANENAMRRMLALRTLTG